MKVTYKAKIEELAKQAKYFRDLEKDLKIVKAELALKEAKGDKIAEYEKEDLEQVEKWIKNAQENCFIGYDIT